MAYKTDLHVHSKRISFCSSSEDEVLVELYRAEGYSTIVLTNHLLTNYIPGCNDDWNKTVEVYCEAYESLRRAGEEKGIAVLFGAEIRFDDCFNDYLLFGADKEFLLANPFFTKKRLGEFIPIAREAGCILVQAHPFRNGMTVMPPELLDGMEVFNGSYGHNSRNDMALRWAERHNLIRTSGSDFHNAIDFADGGILTDEPVTDTAQLISLLKSGKYRLHCSGPTARRDGMCDLH